MHQLHIDGVSRTFGDRRVLTNVSLVVGPEARVGLIGENGAGKSTLLRIVAGLDAADTGTVETPVRTELLRQELPYAPETTVGRVLDDALAEATRAIDAVESASTAVAHGEPDAPARLADALEEADATDAWSAGARRGEVIAGLGVDAIEPGRAVRTLSGGQRSRVAMAALLLARPTALLLDEPTNHLDDAAIAFLERTLAAWPGPVLFASHDRAFLDAVATRVVDLDPAPMPFADVVLGDDAGSGYGLRSSRGGYTAHLEHRHAERERWQQRFAAEQEELNDLRHEVAVTARQTNKKDHYKGQRAGLTKFYSDKDAKVTSRLVRNARGRLETLEREQVRKPPTELRFGGLAAPSGAVEGSLVLLTEAAVAGRLEPVTMAVDPGAKLLVTGANGAGKSTLLLLLDGRVRPTTGTVVRAPRLRRALLAQDVVFADPAASVRDTYRAALGEARSEAVPLSALGLVAGRDVDRPVGALSVGQQRRVALAIAIADPPDLLLLDEPTNHLSLALAEDLEAALGGHSGAVVLASHDRWLRRRWSAPTIALPQRCEDRSMHLGVDSFVSEVTDPKTGHVVGPAERMGHLLEEIALADQVGLYSFGIGEHHRSEYYDSAPQVILAAAAARTERIRLGSAVKVLSADDPVRVFQQFATLDLLSGGRIDLVVGRGSFTEAFPLFGLELADYDALFEEKLDLLLQLRDSVEVNWSGRFRPPLVHQSVYPRPVQDPLPIWVGVGGTPQSFVRAGLLGLPLMVAIIGGEPRQFAPLIDLYRRAGAHAGHAPEQLQVGLHVFGYVAESTEAAADTIYPGWHKMFTAVSRERGFAPPSRPQFDATAGPDGAFFMGDPQTVADKIRRVAEQVGGVDRLSLQMTNPLLAHEDLLRGIELLGTEVAPLVADV